MCGDITDGVLKIAKAEYIAFQFPDRFYVMEKDKLRLKAIELCEKFTQDNVTRKNRVKTFRGFVQVDR